MSRIGSNHSNQREVAREGNEVNLMKRRKRKFEDSPSVFDHSAILHRKQQKYQEERYKTLAMYKTDLELG